MFVKNARPKAKKSRKRDSNLASTGSAPLLSRSEEDVFSDIKELTQKPGFIHSLAALVFRSNVVTAVNEFTAEDFLKIYQPDRLLRTETNLLVGLMLSAPIDATLPHPTQQAIYFDQAIKLLEELHQSIIEQAHKVLFSAIDKISEKSDNPENPFKKGELIREAIFYGGESAFPFQYEALARERYQPDHKWLDSQFGFNIDEAADVLSAIRQISAENFPRHQGVLRKQSPADWT